VAVPLPLLARPQGVFMSSLGCRRPGLRQVAIGSAVFLACWCASATRPGPSSPSEVTRGVPSASRAGLLTRPSEVVRREIAFPVLGDAEAWACLPARVRGATGPLPLWARVLVRPLPRTTAAMLELDLAHRACSPLDPKLRGQIRWAAARAIRCDYGEAYALADLRAAKVGEEEIRALIDESERLPDETRRTLAFARKLTVAGNLITDGEVADLIARYGEKQVVAIVFCVAYSNFLDRLSLALGLTVEPGGSLPPLDVRFARRAFGAGATPTRSRPRALVPPPDGGGLADPDWGADDLADLRCRLETQKGRRARIFLPGTDPSANRWGLIGRTHQPALADAWSACTQAFAEEADQDPIFEQSVFWIVTRTKQCFY
jgi:alkylhydroperoxidase family enzyme